MVEKYKKINKRYLEYSPTHNNKAKSYLYESFNDESSYIMRPNSLDNDKWHQIQTKIQLAKYLMNNDFEEEEENDDNLDYDKYKKFNYPQNNSFNSKKSDKSLNISNEKKNNKKDNLNIYKENKEPKIDNIKYGKDNNNQNNKNEVKEKEKEKEKDNKINININIKNEQIHINNLNNNIEENKNKNKDNIIKNNNININIKDEVISDNDIKKEENKNINQKNYIKEDNNNLKNEDEKIKIFQNNINNDNINKNNKENSEIKEENIKKENIKNIKIKEDEKIKEKEDEKVNNDINNKIKIEEKPKQKNKNNENIKAPKKEKEKVIDIVDNQKKQIKKKCPSDIDISAERDDENSIDWEYDLNYSKNKLQDSTNSENIKKEEPKQDNLVIDKNINIKEEKLPNEIENKETIIKEKMEISIKKTDIDNGEESEDGKEKDNKVITITTKKKSLKKDKKALNDSEDEYLDEFEDIDINSDSDSDFDKKNIKKIKLQKEKEKDKEKEKEIKNEKEIEIERKIDNNKDKNDKSRNINTEKNIKDIKDINDIKEIKNKENEIQINKPDSSTYPSQEIYKKIISIENFANKLTDDILNTIISSEISSNKIKLIPHKSFKYEFFTNLNVSQSLSASGGSSGNNVNKELGLLGLNQFSLNDDLSSLNDSIMSSYSAFSVFNRTIKDKKKEHSLYLYYKKIAPRLIKLIKEEIYLKYPRIYENISMPLKNQSVGLMMSLSLQDADMLRDNYKCVLMKENIKDIIDKEKILKKFEPINKQIRSKDNLTSDNFYDKILNECLVDTAIELINKERLYGENGDPLAWSSRTHELVFKYKKNDPKKLAKYVCNNILKTLHQRVGLITENYDYLNAEQINNERDKRLINNIKNELDEDEYQWRNLEMEETQLKVEIAELIMDQLYNENIEILEHIQFSRNRSDLYQNKSIYACEEIPKLSFQQTTTENALKDKDDGDEVINV